jgi:hypothetical protein
MEEEKTNRLTERNILVYDQDNDTVVPMTDYTVLQKSTVYENDCINNSSEKTK